MNLSLSTSWNSARHTNGYDMVDEIRAAGFDTVELGFALTKRMVEDVAVLKSTGRIKVSSLHNICPLPEEIAPDEASPDYYSLASPDEKERALAVDAAKRTVLCAARLGAMAVVLHAGRVQMKDRTRDLAALIKDKDSFDDLKAVMVREREAKKDGYLGQVIKSLAKLIPFAEKSGVKLGLENRYYYREIPLQSELEIIFDHFRTGIYYWHDIGHAEVFDRLALTSHREQLRKFSRRLLGIHLHDILNVLNDHNVPGYGTCDFSIVKPYITGDTILVMEVHQPALPEEIAKGAAYLVKILG